MAKSIIIIIRDFYGSPWSYPFSSSNYMYKAGTKLRPSQAMADLPDI